MRSVGGAQNQRDETRGEYEDSLKTYRELAKKEPETYLPNVAATLNDLGILDSEQNRRAHPIGTRRLGLVSAHKCHAIAREWHEERAFLNAFMEARISQ
jgi:hypothetical protein